MPLHAHEPLIRVPPFPRASCFSPVAIPGDATADFFSEESLDQIIGALRQNRVGGTYWAPQPALPRSYILVKATGGSYRGTILDDAQVVEWSDRGRTESESPGPWVVSGPCDPWYMVGRATLVIADADDELVLIAAISGVPVRCVGEGRFSALDADRQGPSAMSDLMRREVATAFAYRNPFTGAPIDLLQLIALCAFWRRLIDSNRGIAGAMGFASWKRGSVGTLLWGGERPVQFFSRSSRHTIGPVAVWRSRASKPALRDLERRQIEIVEVEDGFIRSVGLGADCVPPLSIVVDGAGIYFDPAQPSDLETILETGAFSSEIVERARELRLLIVERGVSKYAVGEATMTRRCADRVHILVPGQVEDDRAVLSGLGPRTNLELLRLVRARSPDAYIIYKPHPDVEAGHRVGRLDEQVCLGLADEIVRDQSIASVIAMVDEVSVNTSLAGFEALLRNKRVVTYGVPFYAGWGLTHDLGPVLSRRSARRSLDELVAAALLIYSRYLDPVTKLPCPPEILISRLTEGAPSARGALVRLRRTQGVMRRLLNSLRRGR